MRLSLILIVGLAACAPRYAYRFQTVRPASQSDAQVSITVEPDPLNQRLLAVRIENRTAQPLDVSWTRIALTWPDGKTRTLRPDTDLGWVAPRSTQAARLSPFTLPEYGEPAHAYDGALFELAIPLSPLGEPTVYRLRLTTAAAVVGKGS